MLFLSVSVLLSNEAIGTSVPSPDIWKRNWSLVSAGVGLTIGAIFHYKIGKLVKQRDTLAAALAAEKVQIETRVAARGVTGPYYRFMTDASIRLTELNNRILMLKRRARVIAGAPALVAFVLAAMYGKSMISSYRMRSKIARLRVVEDVSGNKVSMASTYFVQNGLNHEVLRVKPLAELGDDVLKARGYKPLSGQVKRELHELSPEERVEMMKFLSCWGKQYWRVTSRDHFSAYWVPPVVDDNNTDAITGLREIEAKTPAVVDKVAQAATEHAPWTPDQHVLFDQEGVNKAREAAKAKAKT